MKAAAKSGAPLVMAVSGKGPSEGCALFALSLAPGQQVTTWFKATFPPTSIAATADPTASTTCPVDPG